MKKIVSVALILVMTFTLVALTACGGKETDTRLGLGVVYTASATTDFEAGDGEDVNDKNGTTTAAYTVCALTIDKDGKITACKFDAFDATLEYNGAGEGIVSNLTGKYALGNDYGMKAWGGATLEWFEQADKLASVLVGKTGADIKGLVLDTGYGSSDVITAGCTITISDFIEAAEAAYTAAEAATAIEGEGVTLTVTSTKNIVNATADANGTATVTTVFEAACGNEKATASYTATTGFTAAGVAANETVTVTKN